MEVQYYINAYGFLILGIFLILINLPVMIVVCCSAKLRNQYGVLMVSLFNSFLIGVVSVGYGIFTIVMYALDRDDDTVTIAQCFYNPLSFFLLWTFPMASLGLLFNSIDRLLVVSFPLTYFKYSRKVIVVLIALAVVINVSVVFTACFLTLQSRPNAYVNVFCNQHQVFSRNVNVFLTGIKAVFALLSILVMFVVLLVFMKRSQTKVHKTFLTDATVKRFRARQMGFTKTMLISCIATLVIFICPSVFAVVAIIMDLNPHIYVWTRFICFLNFFNIALLIIYRQNDIRRKICLMLSYLCMVKLLHVSVSEGTFSEVSRRQVVQHHVKSAVSYLSKREP
uniref:G_PROTEIN_RECEP_F1_2 domain-containing protein n=1 Tax=Steinernema glaseri TaxID=37863 RepID=A0A1I7ZWF4_9BILA